MRRLSFFLFTILLLSSNSFAFYYLFESMQQDPVSRALGQTEILTTNGGNAIFSNPAHLMDLSCLNINMGGYSVSNHLPNEDVYLNNSLYAYSNGMRLSHITVAMPVWDSGNGFRCSAAAGYQKYFDWGQDGQSGKLYSQGADLLGVGTAITFQNKLAFGFSVVTSMPDTELKSHSNGFLPERMSKYSMTMVNLGLQTKVSDRFVLGFLFRPAYEMKLEDFGTTMDVTEDGYYRLRFVDVTTAMPTVIGLAFRGDVSQSVSLHGEFQTREWGKLTLKAEGNEIASDLDLGGTFRFGIEWRGPVRLRGGFYSTAIFLEDEKHEDVPKTRSGLTWGVGFDVEQLALDFYFNYDWVSTDGYKDEDYYYYENLEPDEQSYHASAVTIGLGITYKDTK